MIVLVGGQQTQDEGLRVSLCDRAGWWATNKRYYNPHSSHVRDQMSLDSFSER